jgi:hypothetical protein
MISRPAWASSVALPLLLAMSGCYSMRKDGPVPPNTTRVNDAGGGADARGGSSGAGSYGTGGNGGPGSGSTGDANDPSADGPVSPDAPTDTEGTPPTECVANLPCTQGIGPCRQGSTTCATPTSAAACADIGADDSKGGCTGGNVCHGGACVPPCATSVPCTEGIKPCRRGATTCASPTAPSICTDVGADDSRGGCAAGTVCGNGTCVTPCRPDVACTQGLGPCRKGLTTCAAPGAVAACMDSGADDARGGCSGGSVCRGGQCVTLKDRNATCASGPECASGRCVDSHCCNAGEKYCDGQCRAGGYCCNGTSCPIANGSGSCSGGSCQVATCNSGFDQMGNQCVRSCGPRDGTCPAGCGFQDYDCKKPNNEPCDANIECRDGNCAGSTRCCPQGQGFIDGACRVPCQEGARRCTTPTDGGGEQNNQKTKNRVLEVCIAGKFQPTDCREGGALAYCGPSTGSCGELSCQTAVRDGSGCCEDVNCGGLSVCVSADGSRQCRTRNGDLCDFGNQLCVPGTQCTDEPDGRRRCRPI